MQGPIDRQGMRKPKGSDIESPRKRKGLRTTASFSALLLAFFIIPASAQEPGGKNLRVFYQQNCAGCHGPDGSAVGSDGKKLRGQDFTDPDWQLNTPDDKMVKTILQGKVFGLVMPGFKDVLTEDEALRLVTNVIRKSEKGRAIAPDPEHRLPRK